MIDYEKRKRIMGRSIKLGHCICNPKSPVPVTCSSRKTSVSAPVSAKMTPPKTSR